MKNREDGSKAVGLFNLSTKELTIRASWGQPGIYGKQRVRDLWSHSDPGTFEREFGTKVPPHGVMLVRMFPE